MTSPIKDTEVPGLELITLYTAEGKSEGIVVKSIIPPPISPSVISNASFEYSNPYSFIH